MVNAQQWLDKNYPLEERNRIKELNISAKCLEGGLKVENFPNLEKFDCTRNLITSIKLNGLPKLETFFGFKCQLSELSIVDCLEIKVFSVAENSLTNLEFINGLNPKKLTFLSVRDNDLHSQDLSVFSSFVNLQSLYIGNLGKKQNSHEYNRFYGSLEPLKGLKMLKEINIGSTDINSGLEFLPDGLQWIYCNAFRKGSDCTKIREKLKDFLDNDQHGGTYDFQIWRHSVKKNDVDNLERNNNKDSSVESEKLGEELKNSIQVDSFNKPKL